MTTFNIELFLEDRYQIQKTLICNVNTYAKKVFKHKLSKFSDNKLIFLKNLINTYSNNLVSIYLNEFNKLNNDNENKFDTTWKLSNLQIAIEDFETLQNSLTEEFRDMFIKIEHKLFSVKQVNSHGEAVNLIFKLDKKQEYQYNSLKKAICFYIQN